MSAAIAPPFSVSQLRAIVEYNPASGVMVWRARSPLSRQDKRFNELFAGKEVGHKFATSSGPVYRRTKIGGRPYLIHCLAWFYMTGEWPTLELDHQDRNGENNRWSNLRQATKSQNSSNCAARSNNKLGLKGVYEKTPGRFAATIRVDKKIINLGCFSSAEKASAAYAEAAMKHHANFARIT